jgi:K+-sensing histidine kinase KdpD
MLYVLIAMITAASAGVLTVDFSDRKQVVIFLLAIIAAGLNTARSYIDTSDSQVPKP